MLLDAARRQLDRVTLTSRAFLHDQLGAFCAELAGLAAIDRAVLPMNTGAEAVETAIKRRASGGTRSRACPTAGPRIVVAENNFHGRTTTIVSFSE